MIQDTYESLYIGIDVGSTTVKAVVVDPKKDTLLWHNYQKHKTRQPEKVLDFLKRIEEYFMIPLEQFRIFITGSGGSALASFIGAKFVQEVNAVALAVEKFHPKVGSVIELGGQDAKVLIFNDIPGSDRKKKFASMNDKCAGGTGAVIDKISAKFNIPPEELHKCSFNGIKLHHVAGKCGVFAETDIISLQKHGIPQEECMASLFNAIVIQNLSVLTRGNTLRPEVLLLGGPNTFVLGMQEAWKYNIPLIWKERKYPIPQNVDPASLINVPENALYFAALGAVEYGKNENPNIGVYKGTTDLERYISFDRQEEKKKKGSQGLFQNLEELDDFKKQYGNCQFEPKTFAPGEVVEGFIGLDGGSTSTKAVLMDKDCNVLVKAYQLSNGNPIEDTIEIFKKLRSYVKSQGASIKILGVGTTGYAKDILKDMLNADCAIVETVAHTKSALQFYDKVDVICDVGGQDIKVMILKNDKVKDFKLNTQCSAGNGYFLQSVAEGFGIPIEKYADTAFKAQTMPTFGYGCAVFMQSDIADFQRQGWRQEEILAGLATVLPRNIWLYVAQFPNLTKLGTTFILQGGTQHNLAAVKAQVDFIKSRFEGTGFTPKVIVHKHCGESGAIGAAIEAISLWEKGQQTDFIGLDAIEQISYTTLSNEDTRCKFCKNKCHRTFIDVKIANSSQRLSNPEKFKIPLATGTKRLIVGNNCEKGLVEDLSDMKIIMKGLDDIKEANPNMAEYASCTVWKSLNPSIIADPLPRYPLTKKTRQRSKLMKQRAFLRIGIPRTLNMYSQNPLFSAYFESLGIRPDNIIYSDFTNEKLYKDGIKRGSIDPCFPSKISIPHIHNLLYVHHQKHPLDLIFFPMIDCLTTSLRNTLGSRTCPTVCVTPEAVKAAFIKERNLFEEMGIGFLNTFINIGDPNLFERQMYCQFKNILGLSVDENKLAVKQGYIALNQYSSKLRRTGREIIDMLKREKRMGIVVLGRPYHNDPGINHGILEKFQKLGYPILTQDSLPIDEHILEDLFGNDVRHGMISHPMDISDVWKNSYSEFTNRKLWAAKYVARNPNLVALDMSSFKCGHDAPIYTAVEEIIERSGTPYFCFKDIDENKPTGSIKIRIETIHYFLTRYCEDLIRHKQKRTMIGQQLKDYEVELRRMLIKSHNQPLIMATRRRESKAMV